MMWNVIETLGGDSLQKRAAELRTYLSVQPEGSIIDFHLDATRHFEALFSPAIYNLYCCLFYECANGEGFTDFCSNIILSGRNVYKAALESPDFFADIEGIEDYNEDSGADVSQVCIHILEKKKGAKWVDSHLEAVTGGRMWSDLEKQVGEISFEPDWESAQSEMPRVYDKCKPG